jgi:hypothetical protein
MIMLIPGIDGALLKLIGLNSGGSTKLIGVIYGD